MMRLQAELAVDSACGLGEGPIWDTGSSSLYWVDVHACRLLRFEPVTGAVREVRTPLPVASLVLGRSGKAAVAAGGGGLHFLDLGTGQMDSIADPEAHLLHTMFNDGKCDPLGRLVTGTASSRHVAEGALYALEPDLTIRKLLDGIACSNGLAWSKDNRKMYYIDSLAYTVVAFDYDLSSGAIIGAGHSIIRFDNPAILPDGMAIDAEGMLWIAEWGAWRVSRWNPESGDCLAVVEVPAQYVTSCAFAGENSEDLYITTARNGLSGDRLAEQPYCGGLFRVRTGVRGGAVYRFGGN